MKYFIFNLTIVLLASVAFSSCNTDDTLSNTPVDLSQEQIDLLDALNNLREAGANCGTVSMSKTDALAWNETLAATALQHANDMNDNDFFAHTGSDGSQVMDRATAQGYSVSWIGENIATGYTNVPDVMQGWQESNSHCELMLNENFEEVGFARVENLWVMVLGTSL